MKRRTLSLCTLAIAGLISAPALGCKASDDTQAATEADYDDVAQALGAVVATDNQGGEIGSISDATSIAIGAPRFGLVVDLSGRFHGQRGQLSYAYSAQCSAVDGMAMEFCNATTDSAHLSVAWSGDLMTPQLDAAISHNGDLQLTDLQQPTVHVNGGGSFEFDATFTSLFRNVERSYHLSYVVTYTDIAVARAPIQVTGGNIHYVIDAERMLTTERRETAAKFNMDASLVFDGSGSARLTLDESHRYTIDPASGAVSK